MDRRHRSLGHAPSQRNGQTPRRRRDRRRLSQRSVRSAPSQTARPISHERLRRRLAVPPRNERASPPPLERRRTRNLAKQLHEENIPPPRRRRRRRGVVGRNAVERGQTNLPRNRLPSHSKPGRNRRRRRRRLDRRTTVFLPRGISLRRGARSISLLLRRWVVASLALFGFRQSRRFRLVRNFRGGHRDVVGIGQGRLSQIGKGFERRRRGRDFVRSQGTGGVFAGSRVRSGNVPVFSSGRIGHHGGIDL
mmetsp:Transcript_22262/g.42978  ORF Transcript_22262/g.42978 Transcript_22262/m.42978 type:complete len:250 (-) Transcript_22262:324-1073(-)